MVAVDRTMPLFDAWATGRRAVAPSSPWRKVTWRQCRTWCCGMNTWLGGVVSGVGSVAGGLGIGLDIEIFE